MNSKRVVKACVICLLASLATSAFGQANLSPKAERVTASVNSDMAALVNDNRMSASSYWHTTSASLGQWEWVELQWQRKNSYTEVRVFWAAPSEQIELPQEAYAAWWDGHQWQQGPTLAEADDKNTSTTAVDITSNRVRIYVRSQQKTCGIRELRIFGFEGDECTPAILGGSSVMAWEEGIVLSPTLQLPDGVETEEGLWAWTLPGGATAQTRTGAATGPGEYIVSYERPCGAVTYFSFTLYDPTDNYVWPTYSPTLNYDFRSEYPALPPPTKGRLPENVNVAREKHGEWWSVAVGPNANALISDTSMVLLAKKMDEDFAYFRDVFGWPPDKRARNGYYSQVYGYGSGLSFDAGTPNTATGGWQSATNYRGSSWPMVFLSYYPIYCFDPSCTYSDRISQQNACVHEGIHATFADLEGCKQSAWFHEGGNTWLQGEAELAKSGKEPESMGWLSAGNMIAPFMPIECYSGWLLDDSFGGPSAEGVNMYNGSQQVCTWRKLLGGVQYGELFPHFLSEIMGRGAIPWIWRYCKTRVLEGMADSLGDSQMRHLILEYRARQAMIDVGQWSKACKKLIDDNWGAKIEQEWSPYWKKVEPWTVTPYANMYPCDAVDSAHWWKPEWRTTPGWSGANQVPLHVRGDVGNMVKVYFKPLGRNMVCMLCYRSKEGNVYYSRPVEGEGEVVLKLQEHPANNVVIAVVCNTDYKYLGEQTRKAHYDYRLRMGENVYQPAKAQLKWYDYKATVKDTQFLNGIEEALPADDEVARFSIKPQRTVVQRGDRLPLHITAASQWQVPVRLFNANGQFIYSQSFLRDGDYEIPADIAPGIYILQGVNGNETSSVKLMVK